MRRVRRTVSIDFRTKKQLDLWGEINMRGIIRLIYMFIRRPKEALFVTGIILVFPAVILIYFGVRYAMGSVAPVDLNNRNCDFTQVTDYTHVSGYVYDAWGHFTIPENNSTCFYIIPKFNDDTNRNISKRSSLSLSKMKTARPGIPLPLPRKDGLREHLRRPALQSRWTNMPAQWAKMLRAVH